ncbi:hypothetical protein ACFFV7_01540 [Nonomuraea spiralis]|uniref:Uncharacterized protein n=1 Tax=Nonomuraea spiralis TaxID=46182 RepID=A0ABV5I5Q2_9ACTN|nr:hypothetical protein [Nonomuraea spiralis]GGS64142.1 hypothetical protein GCM10010176_003090 [Nonomuraea spiralis]
MNATSVDQVEFRWQPGKDFGPVAYSTEDPRIRHAAHLILPMATLPQGVASGHRSLVYLVLPGDGLATIIERSSDPDAVALSAGSPRAGGGRHPQVARALIGPYATVGIDLALACLWQGLDALRLGDPPGQVTYGRTLARLPAGEHEELLRAFRARAGNRPQPVRGLSALVAAVLRQPERPLAAMLPAADLQAPVQGGYLRGLRFTAAVLLRGTGCAWRPSFSTYEPAQGDDRGGLQPHLVFRAAHAHAGAPPTQPREENRIALWEEAEAPADECARVARCLVRAYNELGGTGLAERLGPVVSQYRTLEARLEATALSLRQYAEPSVSAYVFPVQRPAPPAVHRVPGATEPVSAPPAADDGTDETDGMDGKLLAELYRMLPTQYDDGFFQLVEWICAAAGRRVRVPEAESGQIVEYLNLVDWYADRLTGHYRELAASRLAGLLQPLLGTRLDSGQPMRWLAGRLSREDGAGVWARAGALIYARLSDPREAAVLADRLVPELLNRLAEPRHETAARPSAPRPVQAPPGLLSDAWRRPVRVPRWLLGGLVLAVVVLSAALAWW